MVLIFAYTDYSPSSSVLQLAGCAKVINAIRETAISGKRWPFAEESWNLAADLATDCASHAEYTRSKKDK